MLAGRRLSCVLVAVSLPLFSGCSAFSSFVRYERPALFHPETARISEQLSAALQARETQFHLEPFVGAAASDASTIAVRIFDQCAGSSPGVNVSPVGALLRVEGSSPNFRVVLSPQAAPMGTRNILVEVRSCQAKDLSQDAAESKGLLQRSSIRIADSPPSMRVVHPAAIRADQLNKTYDIRVMDKCSGGALPQITSYPPQLLAGPLTADSVPGWYATSINPANHPEFVGDLRLVVRGCAGGKEIRDVRIPIAYDRLMTTFNLWARDDVAEEFGEEFARTFIVADVVFENPNALPILVYGSSLRARVRFLASQADVEKAFGPEVLKHPSRLDGVYWGGQSASDALDFQEAFRPLAYSDVLAIFTNRKESDPRQRTVSVMRSLGEVAAGAAVFVTSADYAKAVSLFTGIVVPELEKQLLWDVILHLKNIEQRSLKEVEEVPGRGQLRRAIFFPQRAILAMVPPFPMYVAEIRPDEVPVTAVLIDKKATVTSDAPR